MHVSRGQKVATVHGLSAFTLEFTFRLHANPYDYHAERTILRIGRDNGQTNSHHQFGYRLPLVGVRNFDGGSSHSPVMYVDHLNEYELSHDQRRVEFPLPFYSPPPLPPASPQPPVAPGWTVASVDTFPGATGWASNRRLDVTRCGVHGSMLGGHGVFGGGAYIEKTFDLSGVRESGDPPHARVRIELTFFAIDSWDGEEARLWVDDELVSTTSFSAHASVTDECGSGYNDPDPGRHIMSADVLNSADSVTVRITTYARRERR